MTAPVRVAVLGGGVAGVVLAEELSRRPDVAVELIESRPRLGGLHRSVSAAGLWFDIGAFIFHEQYELISTFPFLREQFVPVAVRYRSVTPAGGIDGYPCTARGYVRDNGVVSTALAVLGAGAGRWRYRRRATLHDYLRYYLGDRFVRTTGLQAYAERLFGMPESAIDPEFARQRLPHLQYVLSPRRLSRRGRSASIHSTSSALARPAGGFDAVYDVIGRHLSARGVEIRTSCPVVELRREGEGFMLGYDDTLHSFDRVFSTIPLGTTAKMLGVPLHPRPECMDLCSLFYRFEGDAGHDATFLYNFSREGAWKRLTTFSDMYGKVDGADYFTVEVTVPRGDRRTAQDLDEDFRRHVARIGLYAGTLTPVGSEVTGNAYPIFRCGEMASLESLRQSVRSRGVELVGRQGTVQWLNSHAVAIQAKDAVAGERPL